MLISTEWLSDYVELDGMSPRQLAERLTFAGLEAASVSHAFPGLDGILIGEVLSVEAHPNADRLSVCIVSVDSDPLTIICGAPNVEAGQKVAVAPVGMTLLDGLTIERRKIRGVHSEGMICAEDELGLGEGHEGILVLPEDAHVGSRFDEFIGMASHQIELDITPNRPDALGHIGVARDVAAFSGTKLSVPETELVENGPPVETITSVKVHCPDECPRYMARIVTGIKVEESPQWLANRLKAVGLTPLNNVVDITNYVLMETGHPLHAFDLGRLTDRRIEVRLSETEEKMLTLDGVERKLPDGTVLICDGAGPVAIAGIMGGEKSKVEETTTEVLLESAYFNPGSIRRVSKALKLQTDASYRFERGADPEGVRLAVDRTAELLQKIAGGQVAKGVIDVYPNPIKPLKVKVRIARIAKLLGVAIPADTVVGLLEGLEIETLERSDDEITVRIPTFRPDIEREIDIIEEVARLYGYDAIPSRLVGAVSGAYVPESSWDFLAETRRLLTGLGLTEIFSNSMTSPALAEQYHHEDGLEQIALLNYSAAELSVMRRSMIPGLLDTIRRNLNHKRSPGFAIFEIGSIYGMDSAGKPQETSQIAIAFAGQFGGIRWTDPKRSCDFYDLSGVVESLISRISLDAPQMVRYSPSGIWGSQSAAVMLDGERIGISGAIDSKHLADADIDSQVYIALLDAGSLEKSWKIDRSAEQLPVYPAVERDLALVVEEGIDAADLYKTLKNGGGEWLESITIFDVYRKEGVEKGFKSIAFALKFRANDRTLDDETVDAAFKNMVTRATETHRAQVRQ